MQSATEIGQKWVNNTSAAGPAYVAGIQAVTASPMEAAAQAADRYVQGVQRSVTDGTFQRGLRRVSLGDWKDASIKKGANRLADGARQAKDKMTGFLTEFLPHLKRGQDMLASMPRGDINQNIQRMVAMVQHNASFKRT